jgi:hypothetical protein
MKYLSLFIIVVMGCGGCGSGIPPFNRSFSVGDTVVVDVIGHGASAGIVRKEYDGDYYIDFFSCNCNAFYRASDIHPYTPSWDKIPKK